MKEKYIPEIRNKLENHIPVYPGISPQDTAAVGIALVVRKDGPEVLFEKRAGKLRTQPGEICLPGGRMENGESAEEACVREICEELQIRREQINVIGRMNAVMGPSGAPVWPFVVLLSDYGGTYSGEEVEEVFTVPLSRFVQTEPEIYTTWMETRPEKDFPYELIPGGREYRWRRKKNLIYFYRTDKHIIWGMTAKIIADLAKILRPEKEKKSVCKGEKEKNKKS
jgi:8-oxo-dGTP pyrophosphatase MutT (NUDIX family)